MAYQPIENHGIIGNMHTAALVAMDGSIDWFCVPRFDSPSVFGAILDDRKGGRFRIGAASDFACMQSYWPDTNVLITRFLGPEGAAEIADFMPMSLRNRDPKRSETCLLIRHVRGTRGTVPLEMELLPAAFCILQTDVLGSLGSWPEARQAKMTLLGSDSMLVL